MTSMVLIPGWGGNTGCGQARIDAAVTGGYCLHGQAGYEPEFGTPTRRATGKWGTTR